jgi:hypothetical protein
MEKAKREREEFAMELRRMQEENIRRLRQRESGLEPSEE